VHVFGGVVEGGALFGAVGVALVGELVGVVGEAVEGALGEKGVVEEGDPFVDVSVAGDDGAGAFVAFEDEFVEVAALLGGEGLESEVVDDEELGCGVGPERFFGGVVGAAALQVFEEVVGACEVCGDGVVEGVVGDGGGEVGFAGACGALEDDVFVPVEEVEGEEVLGVVRVERDVRVPLVGVHGEGGVEVGALGFEGDVAVVSAFDFVLEDEF